MHRYRASAKGKEDIHTKLMKKYKDIPSWWFYVMLVVTLVISLLLCIFLNDQIQMPWWGLVFASILAFIFTLPISIITATTNQVRIFQLLLPSLTTKKGCQFILSNKCWTHVNVISFLSHYLNIKNWHGLWSCTIICISRLLFIHFVYASRKCTKNPSDNYLLFQVCVKKTFAFSFLWHGMDNVILFTCFS